MSSEINALIRQLIRVGIVSSVNPQNCTAKVLFEDQDEAVSYDLFVINHNTQDNQDYWLPDVNEAVLCLFLPIGIETGFILGSYYSEVDKPANTDPDVRSIRFKDGTVIQYNRETHKLTADCVGDVEVICKKATIKAENQILFNVGGTTVIIDGAGLYINNKINTTDDIHSDKNIVTAGNVTAGGQMTDRTGSIASMRETYNQHTHNNNGGSPPSLSM